MSTPITAAQAVELLRNHPNSYNSQQALGDLAKQVDANSPGQTTMLYSGRFGDLSSEDVAKALASSDGNIRIINNTQAADFLTSRDFLSNAARLDGVTLREFSQSGYRSPTTDWLFHATDGPWADASARFVDSARGEIFAIVPGADPGRTFGAVELSRAIANTDVPAIEGLPRLALAEVSARDGQAAFELVAAQSHARMSDLRVGVNYAGTVLRDDQGQMQLDTRDYFKHTPLQGHAPEIPSNTRDLGELMGSPTAHVQAGQTRLQTWQLEPGANPAVAPSGAKLTRNLGHGAAAAMAAYEVADTAHDYNRLRAQGNLTAAQAAVGRTTSTAGGAWLGFEAGMAIGAPLGPGALATGAVGAVAGGIAGDKLADAVERHRIYTQRGSDGHTWQADPAHPDRGWTRDIPPFPETPQGQHLTASPELADELNYKAVAKATELGLASATARDPFTLHANNTDTFSAYGGDWTRQPDGGSWQRQLNYDKPGLGITESATPARAAQLEAQSRQITVDNAAHSPAAVAATFKSLYLQNDWQRHGKVPEAVDETLSHPNRVVGSDGKQYAHEASGQWTHDGLIWDSHAHGNLRYELNLAVDAQQQQVQRILQPTQSPLQNVPTLETVRVTAPAPERREAAASEPATAPGAAKHAPAATPGQPTAAMPDRLNDPGHPAHGEFKRTLQELNHAEHRAGLPSGPHSEKVAAALMTTAEQQHLRIGTVHMDAHGQAIGIQRLSAFEAPSTVQVDPARAVSHSMEAHTAQWAAARSPHLRASATSSERSAEQTQGLDAMSHADRAMFARIRQDTPAHISDDHVAQAMLGAKRDGLDDASKIGKVAMAGDQLWVVGTTDGFRAATNVAQQAAPMQDTLQQVQAVNQQHEQQLAQDMQPRQDQPGARSGPLMA